MPLANVMLEAEHTVSPNQDIPKNEMEIYFRNESHFLPEGKTWSDLTDKEKAEVKAKYRWDYYRPACYQGITGIGPQMIG